jgi:acyl-CoA thioesterase-1
MRHTPFVITCATFLLLATALTPAAPAQSQAKKPPRKQAAALEADNPQLPRVLLIGDSISMGYTGPVKTLLAGTANVHRPKANCGPTIRGLEQIEVWLGDGRWDVIHFNWGLHDLKRIDGKHQVPLEDYKKNLNTLVTRLEQTGAKLIWCSTTPVPEGVTPPRSDADVKAYNAAAAEIMQEHSVPTNDLYRFALPRLKEIQRPQNVHFTPQGSAVLAEEVARQIRARLAD